MTTTSQEQARRLRLPSPLLTPAQMAAMKAMDGAVRGWKAVTIDATWAVSEGPAGLAAALQSVAAQASKAIAGGAAIIVLSDRQTGPARAPIPALLAVGTVHHHLVESRLRTRAALMVEAGDAREVHHFCLLTGFGADAVCPYMAVDAIHRAAADGMVAEKPKTARPSGLEGLTHAYFHAAEHGMLKVFAKMGISTLASYKGAQIFEALGLNEEVISSCFSGTPSRVSGVGFEHLAADTLALHALAFDPLRAPALMRNPGDFHWRGGPEAEVHLNHPDAIAALQAAATDNSPDAYKKFASLTNELNKGINLRGMIRFKTEKVTPVPLEEVEPAVEIVKRFCTGAMSYGSISFEAHTTLARAMNMIGGKSNTGEGGENPARLIPQVDGSNNPERSAIKQVASGRFGVTSHYLTEADELQARPLTPQRRLLAMRLCHEKVCFLTSADWLMHSFGAESIFPTKFRSRWLRAPSPARAGSSRGPR